MCAILRLHIGIDREKYCYSTLFQSQFGLLASENCSKLIRWRETKLNSSLNQYLPTAYGAMCNYIIILIDKKKYNFPSMEQIIHVISAPT